MKLRDGTNFILESSDGYNHTEQPRVSYGSRRQFLKLLASLGVGAFLSPLVSAGQGNAPRTEKPRLIDLHHHFFPPAFVAVALDKYRQREKMIVSQWTPKKALDEMDHRGVAAAVLSITTPGIWFGDPQAARALARQCNEYAAEMVKDNPSRTRGKGPNALLSASDRKDFIIS